MSYIKMNAEEVLTTCNKILEKAAFDRWQFLKTEMLKTNVKWYWRKKFTQEQVDQHFIDNQAEIEKDIAGWMSWHYNEVLYLKRMATAALDRHGVVYISHSELWWFDE